MPWFVLYTKSRNEKSVAEKLRTMGIDVYCPLIKTRRKWSDRLKIVEEPLFRSYCFVRVDEAQRATVFAVPGVVRYLFWLKKPAVVRDEEIDTIRLMLNEFDHDRIRVQRFAIGDRLTLQSGSLADLSGTLLSQQGKRVSVFIESMQLVIQVDTTRNIVEKQTSRL